MTSGDLKDIEQPEAAVDKASQKPIENKHVERLKHPLAHTWGMWLYRQTGDDWEKDLVKLTTFDTVEDFWCLYHHIKLPSELGDGQYSVFKEGMRPAWEDAANVRGGRWLITLDKRNSGEMDRIWTDMVLLVIGENFENANSSICGVVVNAKAKNYKSKLAIWVGNKRDEKAIRDIGIKLKKILGLPFKITFHSHNSNSVVFSI